MSKPKLLIVSIAAVFLLSLLGFGYIALGVQTPVVTEMRAFWLRLSDVESVELTWQQRRDPGMFGYVEYHTHLTHTLYGKTSRYLVGVSRHLPGGLFLRGDDQGHLWLVASSLSDAAPHELEVKGSLDRRTGKLINQYGMVIPANMPLDEQEKLDRPPGDASGTIPTPHPAWAKPNSGKLLVQSGDVVLRTPLVD